MKTLYLLLITLLLVACRDNNPPKYQMGDLVYLKPDSTIGVIEDITRSGYQIRLGYDKYFFQTNATWVEEEMIFGRKELGYGRFTKDTLIESDQLLPTKQ